jgi:hypothetical protein
MKYATSNFKNKGGAAGETQKTENGRLWQKY